MSETVAAFMLNRLHEWGVKRIYGYPGDGINGLLGAFHEVGDKVEFLQTRHEEIAAFAACAHAKLTGEVGVCMATSGPAPSTCSTGSNTQNSTTNPVLPLMASQSALCWAGTIRKRSTFRYPFR